MSEKKMENIQNMANSLVTQTKEATENLKLEYEEFLERKKRFELKQLELSKKNLITEKVIDLNVGGKHFTTLKSTLLKAEGTMLAAMFSGRYAPGPKDKNGRYFLDRPSKPFGMILNCLRTDDSLQLPDDDAEREQLLKEIDFFGMRQFFKEELREPKFIGGSILTDSHGSLLNKWLNSKDTKDWKVCYKASKDGWSGAQFHAKVNNQGETFTVVKCTRGYIFGGYTGTAWRNAQKYVYDNTTFLFSLKNPSGTQVKLPNTGPSAGTTYSIYDYSSYGPAFGGGHDLYICSGSNNSTSSYTNLGHSFSCPGKTYNSTAAKNFFCGSYNFKVAELEVYRRKKKGEK